MTDPVPPTLFELEAADRFADRHIGPNAGELAAMLQTVGAASLTELIAQTVPADIRLTDPLALPPARTEAQALADIRQIAARNRMCHSLIGLGYHGCHTPAVIQRNLFENPGWYTAYTPYQAEIAQGRLEVLITFQQLTIDLTGLEVANASLLDEATAAAEAMAMARRLSKCKSNCFAIHDGVLPQTLDVLRTRAIGLGIELWVGSLDALADVDAFGALIQYPAADGTVTSPVDTIAAIRARGALVAMACDPMALVLLRSPGELGADIAFGSAQRLGVPMGFGGPHAAFFATRKAYVRAMPGRIIGLSRDRHGAPAYRMSLQTREQHIRREKANSNICTAQVLLANMAALYAIYHGADGLRAIAERVHRLTTIFAEAIARVGHPPGNPVFFDTLTLQTGDHTAALADASTAAGFNLRQVDARHLAIAFDETVTTEALERLLTAFGIDAPLEMLDERARTQADCLDSRYRRSDAILTHPVFTQHRTEHDLLRYLRRLQGRDLALDHSMIPLGSCTMKLNAAAQMLPVSWPEFAAQHPFAPAGQVAGHLALIDALAAQLRAVTGFDAISMQPNSGAQGEYAGLVAIMRYHAARGESARNVCLIPMSAHGTNPASAQMCGLTVVVIKCDERGNIDLADLDSRLAEYGPRVAAIMVTYPSTHGVFETRIRAVCERVHAVGGQVYMDGANLNAQVGLTSPATIGADVSHINLHKTFCIPHGGGGPGMGPIGLRAHLAPYMADHVLIPTGDERRPNRGQHAVSAAPFGSASILPISWMYITMMGPDGLRHASEIAILNANYLARRLETHYAVLYRGDQGRVAHEFILDIRPIRAVSGITELDIAKRLMDYGFHAPTMSFPVAGTIMIEPTESEHQGELDRFADALIAIREEIRAVERGDWPVDDNPLVNAPHTQHEVTADHWAHPYGRDTAAFPMPWLRENKFWPSVGRIDDVWGDRNLHCSCAPMEAYLSQ